MPEAKLILGEESHMWLYFNLNRRYNTKVEGPPEFSSSAENDGTFQQLGIKHKVIFCFI